MTTGADRAQRRRGDNPSIRWDRGEVITDATCDDETKTPAFFKKELLLRRLYLLRDERLPSVSGRRRRHDPPHGGVKGSGFGKDMSHESLLEYTVTHHIMVKHAQPVVHDSFRPA